MHHLPYRGDLWPRQSTQPPAVMIKARHLRRATNQFPHVESPFGDYHRYTAALQHGFTLRDDFRRMRQDRVGKRHPEQLSVRCVFTRDEVEILVWTSDSRDAFVLKPGHLGDLAVGRNQVVGELATISIRHRSHNDAVVLTVVERDLGDFGEIASRNQSIACRIGAELVEINALEKMLLLNGTFGAGITCIIEALAVGRPGETAACSWILNARDDLADLLAG